MATLGVVALGAAVVGAVVLAPLGTEALAVLVTLVGPVVALGVVVLAAVVKMVLGEMVLGEILAAPGVVEGPAHQACTISPWPPITPAFTTLMAMGWWTMPPAMAFLTTGMATAFPMGRGGRMTFLIQLALGSPFHQMLLSATATTATS